MNNSTIQPEKLNLWDRIFNRYRRIVIEEGNETWHHSQNGYIIGDYFSRNYVKYKVIDRLTGSEEIEKIYLN